MAKSEMGRDKLQRTKERLDLKTAQVGEQMMVAYGMEVSGDVTELVYGPQESREDASHPAGDRSLAETLLVALEDSIIERS